MFISKPSKAAVRAMESGKYPGYTIIDVRKSG